eukprot:TRINITY_DN4758_c0_g1_i1.p1 TRINITY_DN4758_c0_g1~~TRINITY_DN4758_c0_g1_i1.p1  ORF type:complete len:660 (-),score=192.99 TRINITY_DN4758_c0_g1_i1:59-2038(-)
MAAAWIGQTRTASVSRPIRSYRNQPCRRYAESPADPDLLHSSRIPTYHFQKSLPKLQIPSLDETLVKYLTVVKPLVSPEEFAETQRKVQEFKLGQGPVLQKKLVEQNVNNPQTSYISAMWYDMYLKRRDPIAININPFMMITPFQAEKNTQLFRAASLVRSAIKMYKTLQTQVLKPEVFFTKAKFSPTWESIISKVPSALSYYPAYFLGAYPLDMSQFSSLFRSTRLPYEKKDGLQSYAGSNHIIVLRSGEFHVVKVMHSNEVGFSTEEIASQLKAILALPAKTPKGTLGIMTTENRDKWAETRRQLLLDDPEGKNKTSLHLLDSALFVLALDDESPKDLDEASRQFLHGNGFNRWFDKSFSLLVAKNGEAAINFEHSWGDGIAVLRFLNEIYDDAKTAPTMGNIDASQTPETLPFVFNSFVKTSINEAEKRFNSQVKNLDLKTKAFGEIGKDFFKSKKISPDGATQMALQMAYHKLHHNPYPVSVYESASTSGFLHGRTETIRPVSVASAQMVKTFADSSTSPQERSTILRKAVSDHGSYTKDAMMGKGVDRHLFALSQKAKEDGENEPLPSLFTDKAYATLNRNYLSTSTLAADAISGGGFGPEFDGGYAVGYMVRKNEIGFTIADYRKKSSDFVEATCQSLREIRTALENSSIPDK